MDTNKKLNKDGDSNSLVFSTKEIETAYNAVFRSSTNQPGFYSWDFGSQIDSKTFRQYMVDLKKELSKLCGLQLNKQLNYQSVGRFNHQHTSKLHRDTANNHSFLMLGYEPTTVDSKVYVADYSKYLEEKNITLEAFFGGDREANLVENNNVLEPYKTEFTSFKKENYSLLLLNNSKSFDETTFGIFHAANIPNKVETQDRVINYMMMQLSENNEKEQYDSQIIDEFVSTNKVNR